MTPPDREITEEEWIAASQACCGVDPVDPPAGDAGPGRAEGEGTVGEADEASGAA